MQVESAYRCKLSPPKSSTFSNHCTLYYKDCQTSLTCLSTISPCLTLAPAASHYRVSPCPGFNSNYLFSFQLTPGAAAAWPLAGSSDNASPIFCLRVSRNLIVFSAGPAARQQPRRGKYWKILSLVKTISGSWPRPVSSCQSSPSQHSVTKPARTRLR